MADVPVRFAGLRGTLAAFAVDLFAGRVGALTDAPMCSGGYDRWGIYDGAAWRLGVASDYAGNANVLSLRINGTEVIDSTQNVKSTTLWSGGAIRIDANGDGTLRNLSLTGWANFSGVTRAPWSGAGAAATQFADLSAIWQAGTGTWFSRNLYLGGTGSQFRAIKSAIGADYPSMIYVDTEGNFGFGTSISNPVADAALSDFSTKFSADKRGQCRQWVIELVTSAQYVKTTDTTIGPSATAKASLLNGGVAAGGFAAVSEPAGRWNVVGAQSDIHLKGTISSVANQVLVFELYRNGASIATLTLPARTYGTRTPWRLEIDQDVRVAGASGTVRVDIRAYVTADNSSSQESCYQMDSTLTGVDLTAAATWDVVCTIPNNAANSITCIKARKVG